MLINSLNTITTINISIILILFLSLFFFQNKEDTLLQTTNNIGINHDPLFNNINKNNTIFITTLKYLGFISLIPLTINLLLISPNITTSLAFWLPNNTSNINLEFNFDLKFNIFLSIALLVSWSIIEFSNYYMNIDPYNNNFFRLLIIFLLNMILLTSTNNLLLLFIGWEGVGFLSFLLISWWFTRTNANNSAIQAVIYNRIGDIGILLFFSLSIANLNSWSFSNMFSTISLNNQFNNLLLLGILIAAAGKSAQFGLHPWLPAAMEGPTPVSALLHSSTMVVAGIFLLIRLSPLYDNNNTFNSWCLILGSLTAIFAATTAISQHDIKKIIAYSTTSQLGLMMVSIGLNQPNIALFHICTHAFFKAMLFLCSGSIIHSLNDEQDIRKMGGLHLILPNTSSCIILGSLALSGIPFLAGFYSKDLILEIGLTNLANSLGIILSLIATLLTSAYSLRIIYFCFINSPTFNVIPPSNEENTNLSNSLNRLAIGTIISGWIISTFILFNTPISIAPFLKNLTFIITLLSIIYTTPTLNWLSQNKITPLLSNSNTFTTNQWFYNNISHITHTSSIFLTSLLLSTRNIDRGWSENIGAQGIASLSSSIAQNYQISQTGYIKQYLIFSSLSLILIAIILTFIN
uniref:NADH-ubiquinone oxidoreductase chain 5 n=1 Tax=Ophidiaster granifer TaxID=2696483 RepID=A0A7S8HPL6_9ECHI|nr:NADH dehydrogenase subunit 5 [Ophidiaster granifer]QPC56391.1 NADH dehydrogenase subunit 5 [Ophidiaster granifer]